MASIPRFTHKPAFAKAFNVSGRRLTGGRWTWMRNQWMRRNPRCVDCGRPGEEVHHVIPRAQRPDLTYDKTNLVTLCKDCHYKRHA